MKSRHLKPEGVEEAIRLVTKGDDLLFSDPPAVMPKQQCPIKVQFVTSLSACPPVSPLGLLSVRSSSMTRASQASLPLVKPRNKTGLTSWISAKSRFLPVFCSATPIRLSIWLARKRKNVTGWKASFARPVNPSGGDWLDMHLDSDLAPLFLQHVCGFLFCLVLGPRVSPPPAAVGLLPV